jgi:hypothetical protein
MNNLKQLLLEAPDSQLDAQMKPLIKKWSDSPAPIEILEVLDLCIHAGLASGVVVNVLQILYDDACKSNNTTHEEVVKLAIWRK